MIVMNLLIGKDLDVWIPLLKNNLCQKIKNMEKVGKGIKVKKSILYPRSWKMHSVVSEELESTSRQDERYGLILNVIKKK